jgi:hypothetical protein
MFLSPEVAIVQQNIGIMQVVGDYFENGMKYFQDLVYTAVGSEMQDAIASTDASVDQLQCRKW